VIFQDEPVQWHLNTSENDRCPWCGLQNMMYVYKLRRSCGNNACGVSLDLTTHYKSGKAFFVDKMGGAGPSDYGGAPDFVIHNPHDEDQFDLLIAQKMSHNGRARLLMHFGNDNITIYWHRDGHVPEDSEGNRIMAAGSDYWHWVMSQCLHQVWIPDESFTPLEVLAKAGTDDPVFMVTSR